MIRHILVTLDGSELAEGVLPHAEDLARRLPAAVSFLQVVHRVSDLRASQISAEGVVVPGVLAEQLEAETAEAKEYLSRLTEEWQSRGIEARWEVVRGTPATSIIDCARSRGVDLIAMSTHGRSGLNRMVFGSVADQVLREAGIPVLLIKPDEKLARRSETA